MISLLSQSNKEQMCCFYYSSVKQLFIYQYAVTPHGNSWTECVTHTVIIFNGMASFFPQAFCLIIKWYPCARDGFLRLPRQVCVVGSHSRTIIYSFYHSQKYTQTYSFDHTSQEHIWAKKRNYHQTVNEIQQRQAYLWECSGRAVSLLRQSPCRSSGRSLVCTGVWGAGLPYSPEE